jgi:hypothetical protein
VEFFAHHLQVDTSHKVKKLQKKKKKKKKLYILPHETHDAARKKRERRRRKKEEGRKLRPTADLDLADHQDPRWRLAGAFLWFFLSF